MSRRMPAWVPKQHGAWAMLVVPYLAGLLVRVHDGAGVPAFAYPLFGFWLAGYFAFNAASTWLKAAPARRGRLGRPLLVCAAVSAAFGLVTLWLAGWTVLAWVPVYACLLVPALWLASRRRERATIGGLLTTAAASLLVLVVGWTSPLGLPWGSPLVTDAAACAALVFGYFGGTVLYVKSNIRERGNAQFARVSVGWHVAWLAIAALGWASGWASAWWAAFFAVTVARAWAVPRRRPGLRPMQLGLIEIALCVVLLVALGAVGV